MSAPLSDFSKGKADSEFRIFTVQEIRDAIAQKRIHCKAEKSKKTGNVSIALSLNGHPLFIQAPGLVNPFLPDCYALKKGTLKEGERPDFKLEFNIDGYGKPETKSGEFGMMIEELEDYAIDAVVENSEAWFGRKRTRAGIIEGGFNNLIKQPDPQYPHRIKTSLHQDNTGQFLACLYDENQNTLRWEDFKPRSLCVPVFLARAIYCGLGCGIQWSTEQVQWFTKWVPPGTRPRLTKPAIRNPEIDAEIADAVMGEAGQ